MTNNTTSVDHTFKLGGDLTVNRKNVESRNKTLH